MINHEARTPDSYIFGFARPFDSTQPELTDPEKIEASMLFSAGLTDLLLSHGDKLCHNKGKYALEPHDFTSLDLRGVAPGSRMVRIVIKAFDTHRPSYELRINEDVENGQEYRMAFYELSEGADEVIRDDRLIMPEMETTGTAKKAFPMSVVESAERTLKQNTEEAVAKRAAVVEELAGLFTTMVENSKFEKEMGLNNQAVGPDEVRDLLVFLARAQSI